MRRGQLPLKRLKESTYLLMTPGGSTYFTYASAAFCGDSRLLILPHSSPLQPGRRQAGWLGTFYLPSVRYCTAMQKQNKTKQHNGGSKQPENKSNDGTKGKAQDLPHTHHGFCDIRLSDVSKRLGFA